ncbi:MAG: hypothetical protein RRB22_01210 [Gammaproteobacteria bacterium]|nr:hypothetical protein [Gammaproteobacteria bacterium]
MATYLELQTLRSNSLLRNKCAMAIAKKAHAIAQEATPVAEKMAWAKAAIGNPESKLEAAINYVLADKSAATLATIMGIIDGDTDTNDAIVQAAIDESIDRLLGV